MQLPFLSSLSETLVKEAPVEVLEIDVVLDKRVDVVEVDVCRLLHVRIPHSRAHDVQMRFLMRQRELEECDNFLVYVVEYEPHAFADGRLMQPFESFCSFGRQQLHHPALLRSDDVVFFSKIRTNLLRKPPHHSHE